MSDFFKLKDSETVATILLYLPAVDIARCSAVNRKMRSDIQLSVLGRLRSAIATRHFNRCRADLDAYVADAELLRFVDSRQRNDSIFIHGGYTSSLISCCLVVNEREHYFDDPEGWEVVIPCCNRYQFSMCYHQGEIWVTGGHNEYMKDRSTVDRLNLFTRQWRRLHGRHPVDNLKGQTIVSYMGRLYILGGWVDLNDYSVTDDENPDLSLLVAQDKVYVLCDGQTDSDMASFTCEGVPRMTRARAEGRAAVYRGRLWYCSGLSGSTLLDVDEIAAEFFPGTARRAPREAAPRMEVFDGCRWTESAARFAEADTFAVSFLKMAFDILVIDGSLFFAALNGDGDFLLERFEDETNEWVVQELGPTGSQHFSKRAQGNGGGKSCFAGCGTSLFVFGSSEDSESGTFEVYDVRTRTWASEAQGREAMSFPLCGLFRRSAISSCATTLDELVY